ncbi:MAG TPA: Fe-S cluster assembly protein HesB [Thermoplasmata archaeon]|jgi:A/G-specific adenine glycosylase|nr:Fe-S cluster assembly protein HesB [Thermoplasmata archaeon]
MASLDSPSKNIQTGDIRRFQKRIFSFYKKNKRDLPWRKTTDPYKILLSELMLQQTQVKRVVLYYEKWIQKWPTIGTLASASLPELLQMWMGLGYNTRVVNLHTTARKIVTLFDSDVIGAMKQYKQLPGIGRYTSQAVQIFSTNADLITVDTNIRRIFISEFNLTTTIKDAELWSLAEQCLPRGKSRDWHNALMDYGALHLTAQKTGIKPKTQQSRFEGSDRQIRARILRCLLQKSMSFSEIKTTFKLEQERLKPILEKMIQEKIIMKRNTTYQLNES